MLSGWSSEVQIGAVGNLDPALSLDQRSDVVEGGLPLMFVEVGYPAPRGDQCEEVG